MKIKGEVTGLRPVDVNGRVSGRGLFAGPGLDEGMEDVEGLKKSALRDLIGRGGTTVGVDSERGRTGVGASGVLCVGEEADGGAGKGGGN